ncbi:MAG TPA: hypothetical protein VHY48_12625 [Acidobacteriaceae bacterium]|nr:hypothetical protein [Acidobacteriaceae bacterium]
MRSSRGGARASNGAKKTSETGDATAEAVDPKESAQAAGLRYVTDARPGIRRMRSGKGFRYRAPDGRTLRANDPEDAETLKRIRARAGGIAGAAKPAGEGGLISLFAGYPLPRQSCANSSKD